MEHRGLDAYGYFEREGSLGRVRAEFAEVVAAARGRIGEAYGQRLHSAYLYGSVPRGTARPGRSDLDLLLALHHEPADEDRDTAEVLARGLDEDFPQIDGVGILLYGKDTLLSEQERFDLGWFLACLCTPLLGADLAEHLPRYRPDSLLARETNGGLADVLPTWRARAEAARTPAEYRKLSRHFARHLVRTGFTLVMPRWGGWTSDLAESAEIFSRYYPERAAQMRAAAAVALDPVADPAVLRGFTEDLGPWLANEYTARHGAKGLRRAAQGDGA
ncbi:nucleotidyltransferase domain-containing protein [Streptomyces sp. APSN-46.1]|uniref:nucleotidyltransferase domain-containing protein n=1 Tax=Streptomyces sp. APSN-46.1 TaxID=2929049 RepID=UPI001FB4554A|nr:nucleotidyltransferase domain-containing protein [Streptomyces sp. APSN-46.1]MCJ1678288.1 nucleotidyltransferase domain-containing protein [Streptomyces sp. APSN-46.1]